MRLSAKWSSDAVRAIEGARVIRLEPHPDRRAAVIEIFRAERAPEFTPEQLNADYSHPGTMRGVHVHRRRQDYVSVLSGRISLGLCDVRRASPTFMQSVMGEVSASDSVALILPPGVAHGLYYMDESMTLIGFSRAWKGDDDIRCHYASPELGFTWPGPVELISRPDAAAQPFEQMLQTLQQE